MLMNINKCRKMKIKASSISNLTDARYFAAWNVKWLGFSLDSGSPHYTSPGDIKEIKDWLVGPQFVGEFGLVQDAQEILTAVELLQLDAVQLSHFTDPAILPSERSFTVIKEWMVEDINHLLTINTDLEQQQSVVDFYLLNCSSNQLNWNALKQDADALTQLRALCTEYPVILSIDCPAHQLNELIAQIAPYALSLTGGEEEAVGVKSFEDLDEVYDVLETMDLLY